MRKTHRQRNNCRSRKHRTRRMRYHGGTRDEVRTEIVNTHEYLLIKDKTDKELLDRLKECFEVLKTVKSPEEWAQILFYDYERITTSDIEFFKTLPSNLSINVNMYNKFHKYNGYIPGSYHAFRRLTNYLMEILTNFTNRRIRKINSENFSFTRIFKPNNKKEKTSAILPIIQNVRDGLILIATHLTFPIEHNDHLRPKNMLTAYIDRLNNLENDITTILHKRQYIA